MLVPEELLERYKSNIVSLKKNEYLFNEGESCNYFYQVKSGQIKMFSISDDGKEYIQGIFKSGESFAEPALLGNFPYPASAIALENSEIWKCDRDSFIKLLKNNFDIHIKLTNTLGLRLKYKAMMLENLSLEDSEHRLLSIIDFYRKKEINITELYKFPYSRQDLANMTGLRVETVIRAIKKLELDNKLQIIDGKIHRCNECN